MEHDEAALVLVNGRENLGRSVAQAASRRESACHRHGTDPYCSGSPVTTKGFSAGFHVPPGQPEHTMHAASSAAHTLMN